MKLIDKIAFPSPERFFLYVPGSFAPEAAYLGGISRYIETPDDTILVSIYDRLAAEYPESPWLSRAEPYRLLKKSQ